MGPARKKNYSPMGAPPYANTRKREGRHKSKKERRYPLDRGIRGDTNISLCQKSYSPKVRQSVVERVENQGGFAGSEILPRAENITNNKCKSNAGDEFEPKGFGLPHSS